MSDAKDDLHHYLLAGREALLWKLDGLSDYDVRRPITPTGTNLLGLVKHVAGTSVDYLGLVFGRPFGEPSRGLGEDDEDNADMWATADESRADLLAYWHRAWAHADATVAALDLDATGTVPWWPPDRATVTLHRVLVHVATEVHRHAGHADIVRETIDGTAGLRDSASNLPDRQPDWWERYRNRLEDTARRFRDQ
ncbi:DinB family protein [Nakamurella deserti]|uniref:DinB family protein n=1 Tax=Nakamurella deserti TaxID=2164074 RepID=UPI000DBE8602|nr:DinB family protein [Nakamurella deserti]